ncbi:MAG: hypothetical protein SGPRY_006522, partial [Prymnesium sp.]
MLGIVLRPQEDWEWCRRKLARFSSRLQARCAQEVLLHHRARAVHMDIGQIALLNDSVARAMRQVARACPALPSTIGIAPAVTLSPGLDGWVRYVRLPQPDAGPLSKRAQCNPSGEWLNGVVCCARAESRIRAWRKGAGHGPSVPPPRHLLHAIVHSEVLPTAVASKSDHWWLASESRWLSVREVCKAFELRGDSPLTIALSSEVCPASAVKIAGRAIHAGVFGLLIDPLDAEGSCSAADFFAEALDARRGKDWVYLHAAEADAVPRRKGLWPEHGWGLEEGRIFRYASSPEAAAPPECDLFVISPDCGDFSKRRHGRDESVLVSGAVAVFCMLGFLNERKATVAVIANVDELDGVGFNTDLLAELQGYAWRSQAIDSLTHAGVPVHRHRRFW